MTESVDEFIRRALTSPPDPEFTARVSSWLDECAQRDMRIDEESLITGLGWRASVCLTHEATTGWRHATAGRWYERAMKLGEPA
jgi:hypothetical protein